MGIRHTPLTNIPYPDGQEKPNVPLVMQRALNEMERHAFIVVADVTDRNTKIPTPFVGQVTFFTPTGLYEYWTGASAGWQPLRANRVTRVRWSHQTGALGNSDYGHIGTAPANPFFTTTLAPGTSPSGWAWTYTELRMSQTCFIALEFGAYNYVNLSGPLHTQTAGEIRMWGANLRNTVAFHQIGGAQFEGQISFSGLLVQNEAVYIVVRNGNQPTQTGGIGIDSQATCWPLADLFGTIGV